MLIRHRRTVSLAVAWLYQSDRIYHRRFAVEINIRSSYLIFVAEPRDNIYATRHSRATVGENFYWPVCSMAFRLIDSRYKRESAEQPRCKRGREGAHITVRLFKNKKVGNSG